MVETANLSKGPFRNEIIGSNLLAYACCENALTIASKSGSLCQRSASRVKIRINMTFQRPAANQLCGTQRVSLMIAMTAIPDNNVRTPTAVTAAVIPSESAIVPASNAPAA